MFKYFLFLFVFLIFPTITFSETSWKPVNRELQNEMFKAAKKGDWEALNTAIEKGADSGGRTLLHWAAGEGHIDDMKQFLKEGADIEAEDKHGFTPLALAAFAGKVDTVKLLIEKGANLEAKDNGSNTPLHLAAVAGDEEVAKILIESKANLEAKDYKDQTPLFFAATNSRRPEVLIFLLKQGADIEVRDRQGKTALDIAIERKQEALDMTKKEQPTPEWIIERAEGYTEIVNILQNHKKK